MNALYTSIKRIVLSVSLLIAFNFYITAQTTLVAGDIAFSGYTSNTTDEFSFVLLKNITSGTVINFTDNGWLNGSNPTGFRSGEQNITYTSNAAYSAGYEIKISGTTATLFGSAVSAGTVTGTPLSLNGPNGDQILAYQGTVVSPTFISAIHMNVYTTLVGDPVTTTAATWDPDGGGTAGGGGTGNGSALPPGLTNGVNAIWIGTEDVQLSEFDNARFACGPNVSSIALARAALNDQANWTLKDNDTPASFTMPANCGFVGIPPLAVQITSFTGKLNSDKTITLQWNVSSQQDIREYIVEESTDGAVFKQLGKVAAGNGTSGMYSYVDIQVTPGNNYYRLKTVEISGKIVYSNIIVVNLKTNINVLVYPNPVTDKLTIQQFGGIKNKTAVLYNTQGKILQQILISDPEQPVNMEAYGPGIYILKLEDGTVFKIIK